MKVLAVIPARYSSTRFAGKVLAKDTGKFLVQHTYERVCLTDLLIDHPDYPMATLAAEFQTAEQVDDPNIVKVIVADSGQRIADRKKLNAKRYPVNANCGQAIYFSRSPIPYDRDKSGIGEVQQYLRHIGIYAYSKSFLLDITSLPQTPLEKIEKLEQLRAIENGYGILVGKVEHTSDGIDTPEQYAEFVKRCKKKK